MKCPICNQNELSAYCTINCCEECFKAGKCELEMVCVNKQRQRLIEASIGMFIEGVRARKWVERFNIITVEDLTPERIKEISEEINQEVDKMIEEAEKDEQQ